MSSTAYADNLAYAQMVMAAWFQYHLAWLWGPTGLKCPSSFSIMLPTLERIEAAVQTQCHASRDAFEKLAMLW